MLQDSQKHWFLFFYNNKYTNLPTRLWSLNQIGFFLQESRKHWFVLAGNSLRYYKDAKAEESNSLDGRIDLSTCYEVSEITTPRNYGFKIKASTV